MSDSEKGTARPGKGKLEKYSKFEVNYRPGHPGKKCGLCRYYQKRSCQIVQGTIEPGGICDKYEKPE